ncbi:DUF6027 family protein [Paractinoplanes hotanensis]|uniref:DUF6027 family protein n=1 Tax=Paractinoplanes hotanensis TaxID=2906497 RepID=A0ABT0YE65_9ACTN|nr:DUF6027 family protein [Actinoplanes hotanensis]MCM4083539.1 DUF6027 family protein [Actinoplanes hotanensis]
MEEPHEAAEAPVIRLERWHGTWPESDQHANFKAEVKLYGLLDPLHTIRGMSRNLGIPVGVIARYVLARWATGGSAGLLEIGPVMVRRLWEPIAAAEASGLDEQRLAAYHQLRQILSWLKVPLDDPTVYPAQDPGGAYARRPGEPERAPDPDPTDVGTYGRPG